MDSTDGGVTRDEALAHFGVKGMHWGVHRDPNVTKTVADVKTYLGSRPTPTKKTFNTNVKKAGGLHNVSDEDLKRMLDRLNMEKRYNDIINEDKKRREEGFKAAGRVLERIGTAVLPTIINVAAQRAGYTNPGGGSPGTFFAGNANVSPRVIEGVSKALSGR